jgi:hypothetical protein
MIGMTVFKRYYDSFGEMNRIALPPLEGQKQERGGLLTSAAWGCAIPASLKTFVL